MYSKTLIWAYLLILSLGTILSLYIPKNEAMAKESVVIPGEAIRLRILANSDTPSDQQLKRDVRDAVNAKITLWVKDLTSIKKAKTVIKSKLPEIQAIAEKTVADKGSNQSVHVEFGKVQFPTKLYGEFLYPAGEYQAILITLGEGKGANWWCVLYPPLCFLDFSNGVAVSDGFDEKVKSESEVQKDSEKNSEKVQTAALDNGEEQKAVAAGNDDSQESIDTEQSSVATASKVEENSDTTASKVEENSDTTASKVEENSDTTASKVEKKSVTATSNEEQKAETTNRSNQEKSVDVSNSEQPASKTETTKEAPVYTSQDEDPVQVKFFVVELWKKLFE